MRKIALVIAATLAALAIGGGLFIGSGYYDIGADDHHAKIVLAIIEQLRERSIGMRVGSMCDPSPSSGTPATMGTSGGGAATGSVGAAERSLSRSTTSTSPSTSQNRPSSG